MDGVSRKGIGESWDTVDRTRCVMQLRGRGEVSGGGVVSLFDVFLPFPVLSRGVRRWDTLKHTVKAGLGRNVDILGEGGLIEQYTPRFRRCDSPTIQYINFNCIKNQMAMAG